MRMSKLFVRTLRDSPTDAATVGHQLLLRAGLLRSLGLGSYGFTPLGAGSRRKIEAVVRQAMGVLGGQEVDLPRVQSADLVPGDVDLENIAGPLTGPSLRFKDRSQHQVVLSTSQPKANGVPRCGLPYWPYHNGLKRSNDSRAP
jgi:prolyl-tRNA synthetase